MSKINELKELRDRVVIFGKENIPKDAPSVIVTNHNRLKDIFYILTVSNGDIVSLVSARIVYKKDIERLNVVNKYLNAFPIEAHGGKQYSDMCLKYASEMLCNNISLSIFPEGAYIEDTEHVYKGRTGAARILFDSLDNLPQAYFLPISINIDAKDDLDSFDLNNSDKVEIKILDPIDPKDYYNNYIDSNKEDRNLILHEITDNGMKKIASSLGREYVDEYIELFPKGNVIFSDGNVVDKELAQNRKYLERYEKDLKQLSLKYKINYGVDK